MKVICVFPITNNTHNIPLILGIFRLEIAPQLILLGATDLEIKFPEIDYKYVETNQSLKGGTKGKGIVDCLKNTNISPDIVIICDGSNKIPYIYIINIFQELISDSSIYCVMANRKNNKSISDFRYLVERFEVFALKKCFDFKNEIPDGQCGLWAYRHGKLNINSHPKEIKLTAEGYEIELDLLGEILEKGLNHSFIDVELPLNQQTTSFKYEDNLKKMSFLLNKYARLKQYLNYYIQEFEQTAEFLSLMKGEQIEQWAEYKKNILSLIPNGL